MIPSPPLKLIADIVSAYVTNHNVSPEALPSLIKQVSGALAGARQQSGGELEPTTLTPAVPIKKSVFPTYIVCLEDGRQLKSLRRHLATTYGMTPEDYRAKWGLPATYPVVAPDLTKRRAEIARGMGLGRFVAVRKEADSEAEGSLPDHLELGDSTGS